MGKESIKYIMPFVLVFLVFGMMAGTASAFNFQGYAFNETQDALNNTNASIEVYSMVGPQGPQLITTFYNSSNTAGFFNVTVSSPYDIQNANYFYKIVLKHFNATNNTLDYIGQSLPQFPYGQIIPLTSSPTNFYLRQGGTINITAVNISGVNTTFKYQVKDTRLGYSIASNFTTEVSQAVVYVPANRNYSIMIYPNQSFPVSYDLNNLTDYTDNYANITFNTSNTLRRVTGYANLSNGSSNFTDLKIVAYLMEPGNMIFQDHPMPYNMSAWNCAGPTDCQYDIYDPLNGSYNITLPGAQMTANILLFAAAYNGSAYYGAFRNISLNYSNDPYLNFNFTLQTLLGTPTVISLNNASGGGPGGPPGVTNVTTKKLSFQLRNASNNSNITGFAHVEVEVNYSAYNGSTFNWMADVSQSSSGSFSIPVINANISKINIFTQDFAPLKTSKTAAQLVEPVYINLTSFNPGAINGSAPPPNIFIDMLKSNAQCDVPNPAQGCSLFNASQSGFNPFQVVIGGGKISLRMRQVSNNITIHYKNVDMLASGPPDALFDPSVNQSSQNGSILEQAWRFGSMGPEIYDEVLIGIPLAGMSPYNVSVKLGKLYDSDWGTAWNISANNLNDLPSDYSTFNTTWFNGSTGMPCSSSDPTSQCYVDIGNRMVWITIPHFSGVGPTVSGTTGNLTATLTNSTGTAGSSGILNFTMIDTVNATSWYNITFPGGFVASGAIVNITINSSADPLGWTTNTSTLFINVSSSIASANVNVNQSVNISNITLPSNPGVYVITVTTNNSVTVSLNYTVVRYGANLTSLYGLTNTTTAGTNRTYLLNLTNSGTANDSYTLAAVINPNSATAGLNTNSVFLASGASTVIALNVTNTTAGAVYVNVTAISVNDSTKFSYINTTTTVTGSIYGVNLTSLSGLTNSTIAGTNVTYLLNLTNSGTVNDSYTIAVINPNSAMAGLNTSSVFLTSGAYTQIALNVTNNTAGIVYVNVSARSNNDSTQVSYINTTTTVVNATGSANGTVTDVRLGIPIANVTITLTNTTGGTYQATTDSNGYYSRSNIVTSTTNAYIYTISASKAGYFTNASATVTVTNSSGANATLNITLRAYNGTLKGTYIKSGTSIGISGASVNITNYTLGSVIMTTDTLGFYSVSIYPGIYDTINVSKIGYSNWSVNATVASNLTTTVPTISLSTNAVTVTANRTVGTASTGQNVSFNLTVVNTGDDANFTVATSVTNASTNVTNVTNPSPLLLNGTSTGYIEVMVNNTYYGGWPVTITISNSTQSKSASITLNAIMRNESASFTNISSTNDTTTTVTGATLVNATIENYANVSGNSTLISNATITGIGTSITDGAVIKGDYGDSNIDNSTVGNATVDSSNLTGSTIRDNASVTNSTLTGATVGNSTLTNVTVSSTSTITNVASLTNITLAGVTVTGDPSYAYEGSISSGTGWANYQTINFTKIYVQVRISQLVIEQSSGQDIGSNTNTSINDTSLGTSMNFSMTANLSSGMVINISETGISPDGAGFSSGTQLGNFLVIRSNDTNASNVTSNTLRLYFDTNPADFSGDVAIYYYNTSASPPAWEALTTTASGTEGGRYFREVVIRHFSTFALLGTTSTGGGGSTGGSSSSGTGGGGVVTGEAFDNIAKSESYDKDLIADTPVTYTFKAPELGVYEIAFTDKENENGITLRVEVLKGTSKQVTVQAPGTVYKNINILSGTKRMKEALVRFKVENSWLSSNSLAGSDVKLVKWDGSQWVQLETAQTTKDDTYTNYEAKTDTFSVFAITGLKGGIIVPTATPAGAVTETPGTPTGTGTPAPSPTRKVPAFEFVLTVAILSAAYLFGRKRR